MGSLTYLRPDPKITVIRDDEAEEVHICIDGLQLTLSERGASRLRVKLNALGSLWGDNVPRR